MKFTMWATAALLAFFSVMHVFVTYEHVRQVGPHRESVLTPALTALLAGGLALWAMRRARRASATPNER